MSIKAGGMLSVADANRQLELIILPTEKCNFRCTYCYEDFAIGKMRLPVRNAIKSLIGRRVSLGLDLLKLTWFGGEPLLAKEIIFDIAKCAYDYHLSGQLKNLTGTLTTNAYLLTVDVLERLVSLRHRQFQVSLDGFGEGHDQTRKYASGAGTFSTIWNNLILAKASCLDFHIVLRVHLTVDNSSSIEHLVDEICKNFSKDSRFSVLLKRVTNLGGSNGAVLVPVSVLRAKTLARALSGKLIDSGVYCVDGTDGDFESQHDGASVMDAANGGSLISERDRLADANNYVCYASRPNSLMIRPDGRVGKCTVVFDDPRNTVGKINEDGSLFLEEKKMAFWLRGNFTGDPVDLGCPARGG